MPWSKKNTGFSAVHLFNYPDGCLIPRVGDFMKAVYALQKWLDEEGIHSCTHHDDDGVWVLI